MPGPGLTAPDMDLRWEAGAGMWLGVLGRVRGGDTWVLPGVVGGPGVCDREGAR